MNHHYASPEARDTATNSTPADPDHGDTVKTSSPSSISTSRAPCFVVLCYGVKAPSLTTLVVPKSQTTTVTKPQPVTTLAGTEQIHITIKHRLSLSHNHAAQENPSPSPPFRAAATTSLWWTPNPLCSAVHPDPSPFFPCSRHTQNPPLFFLLYKTPLSNAHCTPLRTRDQNRVLDLSRSLIQSVEHQWELPRCDSRFGVVQTRLVMNLFKFKFGSKNCDD